MPPISIFEALDVIYDKVSIDRDTIQVPIFEAIDQICATSYFSKIPLPPFDNSAMDGYALRGEGKKFKVIGKVFAGECKDIRLNDGEAVRIFTGAKTPSNANRVAPQEIVKVEDDHIILQQELKNGANIRHKGEDIDLNERVISDREKITSAHIALLASQGIEEVEVFKRVRVGVFASGSELKLLGEELNEGEIYNSNTPYLMARARELGCEVKFLGKSRDDKESIKEVISRAKECDLIVTSGGVSVGDADFTKEAFDELGMQRYFQKVAIKPGKPTTFGKLKDTFVLNLPGNPLASALNFEIFGKFIINLLSKIDTPYLNFVEATLRTDLNSPREVTNIIPGIFDTSGFKPTKKFAPGNVNVLNHCNSIIAIDPQTNSLKEGDSVKVLPINWRFFRKDFMKFTS